MLLVDPGWCVWCYHFGIIGKVEGVNSGGGRNLAAMEKQFRGLELEGNGVGDVVFRSCEVGKVYVLVFSHQWTLEIYQDTIVKYWSAARCCVHKSAIVTPIRFEGMVEFMIRLLELLSRFQSFA